MYTHDPSNDNLLNRKIAFRTVKKFSHFHKIIRNKFKSDKMTIRFKCIRAIGILIQSIFRQTCEIKLQVLILINYLDKCTGHSFLLKLYIIYSYDFFNIIIIGHFRYSI